MKLFVAVAYSAHVNYETGEVLPEYKAWLEGNLAQLEKFGHTLFCALRADQYKINNADPAAAFTLDEEHIQEADGLIAFIAEKPSEGVQTEVGMAITSQKPIVLAHPDDFQLGYFNRAIISAGRATEAILPLSTDPFASA